MTTSAVTMAAQHWKAILETENKLGNERVIAADWLNWADWDVSTIITSDGARVRLVLLNARQPGKGAFSRLVRKIERAGLVPVLVEPSQLLKDWCVRHDWRERVVGQGVYRHHIWHPRRESHHAD